MKQIIYLFAMLLAQSVIAQQTIRGTVSAASGTVLEGTSVKIKGQEGSTVSGKEGRFVIYSNRYQPVLIFSHIGYQNFELKIDSNNTDINIVLTESSVTMKEVTVSTGYQELKKGVTTGSFDKIDNSLLNRTPSMDVLSKLEGVSSGLYVQKVGGSPGIFIRGLSTLHSSSTPLIVLDNFPYDGDMNNINPNDVESITLLKDASAAAIWGARAGNGVIVISTKKGRYGEKARLSFSSDVTIQQKPDIFKDAGFLNSNDFIDVEKFLFTKGIYDGDLTSTGRPLISPVVEILAKQRAGLIAAADAEMQINAFREIDVRNEYKKYLYRTGVRQQYSLGLSGGSAMINYRVNGGYDKNISTATGNLTDRATVFAYTNIRPVRKLELQLGINYTHGNNVNNNIGTIMPSDKGVLYPYARLADASGNPLPVEYTYRLAYVDTAGGGLLLDWKYRPLDEMKLADNSSLADDILLKLNLRYQVSKDLQAEINGQFERSFGSSKNFSSPESYNARNMINRFSQRSGTGIIRNLPAGGILDHTESKLSTHALRAQLNYNYQSGDHQVMAIAGAEIRQAKNISQNDRVYGYDNNTLTFSTVNNVTNFPWFDNLGSSTIPAFRGFSDVLSRFIAIYTNASYTYKNRYTFSGSARKDASNLFGVETNNKWTPLWSGGVSWKISDESFYHLPAFPLLRVRFTYGYNGNVRNDLAAVPTIRYVSVNSVNNLLYAQVNSLPNPQLRWETTGILNIGIDIAAKNDIVSGSIEYFHKKATDLLSPTRVDPTIGLSLMTINAANLSGDGVDVKLNFKISDKAVKVNTLLFFSYVTNRVTKYFNTIANKGGYTGTGYSITPIEGKDPYSIISYRWGGLDPQTGDPMGYLNGVLSKDYAKLSAPVNLEDLVFTGPTRPPYFGNIINSFSWKGITLSANIGYKMGFYFRRSSVNYNSFFSSWSAHKDYSARWKQPGDEVFTSVPSMVYPSPGNRDRFYNNSEATVEKGDNIRLQDISLSYEPVKMKYLNNFRFYIYASNLGMLWSANKHGIDPDYGTGVPPGLSITFGIKTNF